jgi:Methyltransferase domain
MPDAQIPTFLEGSAVSRGSTDAPSLSSGKIGSLNVFWSLIDPILARLAPQRLCEIGVETGAFTERLLVWSRQHECSYIGIDPSVDPTLLARWDKAGIAKNMVRDERLLVARSLDVLPSLESCDVYFLDGDHNYFTVHNELELIVRASTNAGAKPVNPLIFVHDISWPWGRRDMYYQPDALPTEARHPYSDRLGVCLESDDLIDGGLRAPGQYCIALHGGGPRNGVLTAVEDFLSEHAAQGWESIVIPAAYGLAILYQPGCASRDVLEQLRSAGFVMRDFLAGCEANYLTLYLYLSARDGAHFKTVQAYEELHRAYQSLHEHSENLAVEYQRLLDHYIALEKEYNKVANAYRTFTHPEASTMPAKHLGGAHSAETHDNSPAESSPSESASL